MLSLADHLSSVKVQELARKDAVRRACVKELTARLNAERARDNEMKIERYVWTNHVGKAEAIKVLKKHPDKRERWWPPYTERAIHFKTVHLDERDLRDFTDMCNKAEKDNRSYGKTFNGLLKVK